MDTGVALSLDHVEYDFEDYVLEHGIPETLDPLPYRKVSTSALLAWYEKGHPSLKVILLHSYTNPYSYTYKLGRIGICLR